MEDQPRPWLNLVPTKVGRQTADSDFGKTAGERETADPQVRGQGTPTLVGTKLAKVRAVPQTYAGVRFRSTLEADWAATLDHVGLTWSYEPEAVQLPSGLLYRPDFWLPTIGCWLEVKGPGVPGAEKAVELSHIGWVIIGRASIRGLANWMLCDAPDDADTYWVDKWYQIVEYLGYGIAEEWASNRPFERAPRAGRHAD